MSLVVEADKAKLAQQFNEIRENIGANAAQIQQQVGRRLTSLENLITEIRASSLPAADKATYEQEAKALASQFQAQIENVSAQLSAAADQIFAL